MKTLVKLFVLLMAVTLVGACSNSGGEGGEKGAEKAKEVTAKDFGTQMCDVALKGEGAKILDMMHPKVVAKQAEMSGVSVEELTKSFVEAMGDKKAEVCEVTKAEEGDCSEEVLKAAEELELKLDGCAEVTTKVKMGEEEASEDTATLIKVEGKWYLSII